MNKIVSYSELYSLDTCERLHMYRFILNLRPIEDSEAIATGVKGHRLLQSFYEGLKNGMSKEESLEHVSKQASKIIKENPKAPDFPLLTAWTLVKNFIDATNFTAEAVLVENRFLLPLSKITDDPELQDVQVGFTPDVVLQRKGGFVVVEDAKFVQRAWSRPKINRYTQTKLYQIFLNEIGYGVSRCSIRFFNTKTGKVIEVPAGIKNPQEEQTVKNDFLRSVKRLLNHEKQPMSELLDARRTSNYTVCQFCQFEYVCTQQAEGHDVSKTLKYEFVESDYDYRP